MIVFIFSPWITLLVPKLFLAAGVILNWFHFFGSMLQQAAGAGMTPEILSSVAAILLSLAFSYIPKLNTWYAGQDETTKRLVMVAALVIVAGGSFALSCAGLIEDLFGLPLTCDRAGAVGVVRALIFALVANQATFLITPPAKAVKEIKALKAGAAGLGLGRG